MIPADPVPVPRGVLRHLLALCRHGQSPKIHWSEDRAAMDRAAMQERGTALAEIEKEVEFLIPEEVGS